MILILGTGMMRNDRLRVWFSHHLVFGIRHCKINIRVLYTLWIYSYSLLRMNSWKANHICHLDLFLTNKEHQSRFKHSISHILIYERTHFKRIIAKFLQYQADDTCILWLSSMLRPYLSSWRPPCLFSVVQRISKFDVLSRLVIYSF